MAARLRKTNRRLSEDKAMWLAGEWSAPDAQGRWAILGMRRTRWSTPAVSRGRSAGTLRGDYRPVLAVEASDDSMSLWWKDQYDLAEYHQRLQAVPDCRIARVEDAGHMLHHDQPLAVAQLIEDFCR